MTSFADMTPILLRQSIELPSWAFGNSGTRFKVFGTPGTPRTPEDVVPPSTPPPDPAHPADREPAETLPEPEPGRFGPADAVL